MTENRHSFRPRAGRSTFAWNVLLTPVSATLFRGACLRDAFPWSRRTDISRKHSIRMSVNLPAQGREL